MNAIISWIRVSKAIVRYLAYRIGLVKRPCFLSIRQETACVVSQILHWKRRMRVVHPERCPKAGPVIFVANHIFLEDPFVMYFAVAGVSEQAIKFHPMMREGVFASSKIFNSKLIDVDEFVTLFGVMNISRDNVRLSQLKPFIQVLRERDSIMIYPTRTRTRTGAIIEFPKGFEEPGGVSFFVVQAQRNHPDLRVAVAPITRTDNLVNDTVTLVFGEPQYLDTEATREEQRAFDYGLIPSIAENVAINLPQVLSALIYLRCLHGMPVEVPSNELKDALERVFARLSNRLVEQPQPDEFARSLAWLEERNALKRDDSKVVLNREVILSAPEPDREYKRKNPVKFLANQILHLDDVIAAIESEVLPPKG